MHSNVSFITSIQLSSISFSLSLSYTSHTGNQFLFSSSAGLLRDTSAFHLAYVHFIYNLYHFIYNSVIGIFLLMININLCTYILDSCCNKLLS